MIHSAAVVLLTFENKVYLCQRTGTEHLRGLWCGPGGKLEANELPKTAAKRELLEEAGIETLVRRLVWFADAPGHMDDGTPYTCHTYLLLLAENEVPIQTEAAKHGPWKLFTLKEAAELPLVPGLKDVLVQLAQEVSTRVSPV